MRSFRVEKLASTIRDIVSRAITHKLHDPRISPMTSVLRVEVSGDLQVAKVHVTVLGEGAEGRRTLAGLSNAVGRVQRMVAQELTIRRCPEIRFVLNDSLKRAAETVRIIDQTVLSDDLQGGEAATEAEPDGGPDLEGGDE
ncbi:MAG TPA: 30S ribosome-binding factor RbfA [Phycisphaerae bacterium]|nr:30S ribosome-binding factor RbfA [Phycisphaerae bacterium]